uniref:Uncharacterized protein n=1 Tax=Steinernema glaseri TaxID=37863 RepID=A0A1I7Y239_9BILA
MRGGEGECESEREREGREALGSRRTEKIRSFGEQPSTRDLEQRYGDLNATVSRLEVLVTSLQDSNSAASSRFSNSTASSSLSSSTKTKTP